MDKGFNIQYINKTGAALLGKSKQELTKHKCADVWNTTSCKTKDSPCQTSMDSISIYECDNDTMLGDIKLDIHYAAAPLKDINGEIVGSFEFVVDQSDIKQAAKLAQKSNDFQAATAEEMSASSEELAAMAQELQTMVAQFKLDSTPNSIKTSNIRKAA